VVLTGANGAGKTNLLEAVSFCRRAGFAPRGPGSGGPRVTGDGAMDLSSTDITEADEVTPQLV